MTHTATSARLFKGALSVSLAALLIFSPFAEQMDAQVAQTTSQIGPKSLHIDILEGEGASNNIRQRDAREPVIQVTDENHKPVGGVAVVFLIHGGNNGGTASFNGSSMSLNATTGPDGIAHAQGLQVGQAPGSFTISVSASLGQLVAQAIIHQATVLTALGTTGAAGAAGAGLGTAGTIATHGIFHLSKALLIAGGTAAAAGAVAGVVVATRNAGGTSVTLGTGTVGPPTP